MTADEGTGRFTPYELVFEKIAAEEFPAIAAEAAERQIDAGRRDRFAHIRRVAMLTERLVPEAADTATLDRYLDIFFHCFHFWGAGCPIYAFAEEVIRDLIERAPDLGGWWPPGEEASAYLELPRNLLWAAVTEGEPPEPVEGLFVRVEAGEPALEVLVVLGMRADRPGFSVAGLRARRDELVGLEVPGAFRSDIPGAELAGLYSLQRGAEVMMLSARALWYLERYPGSLEPGSGAGPERAGYGGPTGLDHHRVRLVERSQG